MAMQVILTEDVPKLGDAGDVVRVRDGYARNFLIPKGLALLATEGRKREIEHQKRVIEEKVQREVRGYQEQAKSLSAAKLAFERQSGEEGKLFGSVTNADIAEQLAAQGFEIDRRRIELAEPIKEIGEHEVNVRLHREVSVGLVVTVTAAGQVAGQDEGQEEGQDAGQDEGELS